jgi:hypothetical protein
METLMMNQNTKKSRGEVEDEVKVNKDLNSEAEAEVVM